MTDPIPSPRSPEDDPIPWTPLPRSPQPDPTDAIDAYRRGTGPDPTDAIDAWRRAEPTPLTCKHEGGWRRDIFNFAWCVDCDRWRDDIMREHGSTPIPSPDTDLRVALIPARFWQLALAKSIEGLVVGDAWEAAAAIKGRLDSRGVVLAVDPTERDRPSSSESTETPTPSLDRLAEIVSDSLAAATMGTDYAEAPEPSDEPGSPYVMRLTNEIRARLISETPTPPEAT